MYTVYIYKVYIYNIYTYIYMTWDISISETAAHAPWTAPVGRGPTKSRHCHWSARPAAGPPASFSAGMMIPNMMGKMGMGQYL